MVDLTKLSDTTKKSLLMKFEEFSKKDFFTKDAIEAIEQTFKEKNIENFIQI